MSDSSYPSQQQDKFVLRLPDGMRDRIRAAADANNRSMNAEIISRLESSLEGRETVANLSINIDLSAIGKPELKEKLELLSEHLEAVKRQTDKPR